MKSKHCSMSDRVGIWLFCLLLAFVLASTLFLPVPASADMGPHPSVYVYFENLGEETCYATLLCYPGDAEPPLIAYRGTPESYRHFVGHNDEASDDDNYEHEIWQAFVDYDDPDDYDFVQWWFKVSDTPVVDWLYWAPDSFKILLYYPERNGFASSDICERYAFDSYYTVDMSKTDLSVLQKGDGSVAYISSVKKSYPYPWGKELLSLLARMIITVGLEVGVALLFRLWEKKTLLVIIFANVVTQLALNIALNIHVFYHYSGAFTKFYLQIEVCVFVLEALLYCLVLNKFTAKEHKQLFYVAYSLVANTISFLVGIGLAYVIPSLF